MSDMSGATNESEYDITARRLVEAHRAADPETRLIFLHPDPAKREICLLEVSSRSAGVVLRRADAQRPPSEPVVP